MPSCMQFLLMQEDPIYAIILRTNVSRPQSISYKKKGWYRALMHAVHTKVHMQETYVVLRLSLQNIMEESWSCLLCTTIVTFLYATKLDAGVRGDSVTIQLAGTLISHPTYKHESFQTIDRQRQSRKPSTTSSDPTTD